MVSSGRIASDVLAKAATAAVEFERAGGNAASQTAKEFTAAITGDASLDTVYADKDRYLAYDSDNLGEDNYRLADNDSLKIEREVENSVNYFNTTATNYAFCKIASDKNVKTDEIKMIIDSIMSDNIPEHSPAGSASGQSRQSRFLSARSLDAGYR